MCTRPCRKLGKRGRESGKVISELEGSRADGDCRWRTWGRPGIVITPLEEGTGLMGEGTAC